MGQRVSYTIAGKHCGPVSTYYAKEIEKMDFIIRGKSKDLLKQITDEWEQQKKLDEVKQTFTSHRTYINSLSYAEYQDFKRHQREHFDSD